MVQVQASDIQREKTMVAFWPISVFLTKGYHVPYK
jgi:hypothetical protein